MDLTNNAGDVAAAIDAAADDLEKLEAANAAAAAVALAAIDPETPRRTGTLAAGARCVADPMGFTYSNATPYAVFVDATQGFATDTLREHEAAIAAVYQDHIEASLSALT